MRIHAGGLAGASLIEEDHAVILQETIHPPAVKSAETRAWIAGTALEEDGVGRVFLAGTHDLARENLDGRVICAEGTRVIEGDVEAVLVNGVSVVDVGVRTHGTRVAPQSARRAGCAAESSAGAVPPAAPRISHEVGKCRREQAVSFGDFVWRDEAVAGASNAAGRAGRGVGTVSTASRASSA